VSTWAFILVVIAACVIAAGFIILMPSPAAHEKTGTLSTDGRIPLPAPKISGTVSVEEAVMNRRSVREYATTPLEISEISQLL
jgi:hypothetical protein